MGWTYKKRRFLEDPTNFELSDDAYDLLLRKKSTVSLSVRGRSHDQPQMVNDFGKNQSDLPTMTHEVSKYALYFVYLGLVVCVSSYAGE
ncbi:NHPM bacteriocin system ABC transporter, ATP-binding protein [Artemisia annua]|uniref:NHPM bacteriocin system ABC transporter, ATP-binding protein n=1 Tax=Artemisia annua TaxID=35608 RepID=A0A2U1LH96_ARTAN|nr:NHPM bacteriocin system ABC transporter, ATP-binding protein [Artemisia annua]